ncbi:pre-mRNA-splicing factor CWC22 [Cryptococcus sp. DSM 104548]
MPRSPSPSRSPSPRRSYTRSPSPRPRSDTLDDAPASKRKRSPSPNPRDRPASPPTRRRRSQSPPRRPASQTVDVPRVNDVDPVRRRAREQALLEKEINRELAKPNDDGTVATRPNAEDAAKAEFAKLLGSRSGGAYIPPARLRAMQAEAAKDKTSAEYQRMSWDALKKSINGLINKVNISNIKHVVPELFGENLIRGKGLFARSIMRAQASSLPFTPVFAALVAIINTKLPQVGELVLIRLISQFRRAYKRNDKIVCHATSTFIAHLCNQYVAHEIVALQILLLCLDRPTDDSIEIAVGFMREVGLFLSEISPKANNTVFERFRAVLHEGEVSKRCQYMIEVLFQVRKDKFMDNPSVPEGLDLVEEDEQITHKITLDDELKVLESLNLFKVDPNFLQNEERYAEIKREILGDSDDEESGESGSDESDSEDDEDDVAPEKEGIQDMTETNLINLRRTIYLTIMNSLNYEEAVHKLMKINIPEGREIELCNMIVECCSQERAYSNFYGLIGERFCKLNRVWTDSFQEAFEKYYDTIHRYETNKLRNIARFFGHLLASDGISWGVLHVVHMNEDETTSSSRIFVKIMLQEMGEELGVNKVAERFRIPDFRPAFAGMFPMDNPKNTRFAINYFTSIGMGKVTEDMREYLQNAPKLLAAQHAAMAAEESSSDSDSSSDSSDSDTDSDDSLSSDYSRRSRRRRYSSDSRSPPRRRDSRSPTYSRSPSPPPRRRYDSRSPPPRRDDSRSPPPPRRYDSRSPSPRAPQSAPRRPTARGRSPTRSVSRSPSPAPRRRRRDSYTPSPSPPRRRDSPPPRRYEDDSRSRGGRGGYGDRDRGYRR